MNAFLKMLLPIQYLIKGENLKIHTPKTLIIKHRNIQVQHWDSTETYTNNMQWILTSES